MEKDDTLTDDRENTILTIGFGINATSFNFTDAIYQIDQLFNFGAKSTVAHLQNSCTFMAPLLIATDNGSAPIECR